MNDFVALLVARSRAARPTVDETLDDALTRLDHLLAGVSADLGVEYYGPCVGVEAVAAHRLVVRAHAWDMGRAEWGVRVCSAAPQAHWRSEWTIRGAGRLRKALIVRALPEFFAGYAQAVVAAGREQSASGQRVAELAQRFSAAT